jgi:hypothetical protein
VGVQGVGRLEHGHGAAGAAEGQQQALEHLVGAVGAEDLLGTDAVDLRQRRAQRPGPAVGIAVELDARQLGAQRVHPGAGRRDGRLVGVEPDRHVHLGRVVPLDELQVGSHGNRRH